MNQQEINKHNYEHFLVDYAEGNLSESLCIKLEAFLLVNPDIQQEFEQFNSLKIKPNKPYPNFNSKLKRIPLEATPENSDNFQELCIGHLEDLNSPIENELLFSLLTNDVEKQKTFKLYQKTKLNSSDLFLNEKLLLKKENTHHIIKDENFESYCIASSEGWLNAQGLQALIAFTKTNAEKQKIFKIYHQLNFKPDYSILLPNKHRLKKSHLFSERNKRWAAYVSAIAAIMVFSLLIFNANHLKTQDQFISSIHESSNQKNSTPSKQTFIETIPSEQLSVIKSQENITPKQIQKQIPNTTDYNPIQKNLLTNIEAIKIFKIECPKCVTYSQSSNFMKMDIKHTSLANLGSQTSREASVNNDELGWKLAQASINGINMLTSTDLALKKKETNEKTRIAFNSKHFSFSVPIKKK